MKVKNNGIHPIFQTVVLSISILVIFVLCIKFMHKFCALDLLPPIHFFDNSAIKNNREKIDVGFSVTDLIEFNTVENRFVLNGIISFVFNPKKIKLETIGKFTFEKGIIEYKSEPITSMVGDKMIAKYNIKLVFMNNMYYGYFPFEDHKIYIVLDNSNISLNDAIFVVKDENLIVNKDSYISGWEFNIQKSYDGYTLTNINVGEKKEILESPRVIFELDFYHHSYRYLYLVILPLLLIFIIEMFSFSIDQEIYRGTLFHLSVVNIGALFAYRFVIQNIAPNVGYLTISDFIFFLFLSTSFITFLINCTGFYFTVFQKKLFCVLMQIYVIVAFIYILEVWPKCQ